SENYRPVDENGNWTDGCKTGPTGADNAMDIIAFSSRGPSPGQRIKPEVIAPGTHITGTRGNPSDGTTVCDSARPLGNATYAASSGTSHSTPAISGVASLAWWWIANGEGALAFDGGSPSAPSPALMKAYLIAHPTYLTGVSGNGNLPTNAQGYGMPNLQAMFSETPTFLVNQTRVLGATGETWNWVGSAVDPTKPVRIALVWTDAAGAIGTSPQVNNLDLRVEYGSSTYLGNVFTGQWSSTGGTADIRNNYEAVFIQPGSPDAINITVTGFNIAGDGVPGNADTTDQDFAIVCSNCAQTPTFTLGVDPTELSVCTEDTTSVPFNITAGSILGFSTSPTLSASGNPAGTTTAFSVNPVPLPGNSVLTVGNLGAAAAGTSTITITGTAGSEIKTRDVDLTLFTADPGAFALTSPATGAQNVALSPVLSWAASTQAASYTVEVASDASFNTIVWSGSTTATSVTVGTALNSAATYYWRVTAENECGETAVSQPFSFITVPLPGDCPVGVTPTDVYTTDFEGDNAAWVATTGSGTANWAISGLRTHSGAKAFLAADVAVVSDQLLTSPAVTLPTGQNPLALLFWNHQTIEDSSATACFDGAMLQISTNDGASWTQVPDALLQVGPYQGPISSSFSNPAAGLRAWCGDPQDWTRYVVNLDSYAGQTVKFRFRMTSDSSVGRVPDGFYLDDVKVQACGSLPDVIYKDGFDPAVP
ncbi:MAG TPA: S8 family serine peptidase, partial [Ilumatobacteraceae bacterium]|nr:S8 family serine peptidase [Ilumatobacteraceae bacterium]